MSGCNKLEVSTCKDNKLYIITGTTRFWLDELETLGGKRVSNNSDNNIWVILKTKNNFFEIDSFVEQVNSGILKPSTNVKEFIENMEQIKRYAKINTKIPDQQIFDSNDMEYQTVTYSLPKPSIGQKIIISHQGVNQEFIVVELKYNGRFIHSFYVQDDDKKYIRIIINDGTWAADIYIPGEQTIYFKSW